MGCSITLPQIVSDLKKYKNKKLWISFDEADITFEEYAKKLAGDLELSLYGCYYLVNKGMKYGKKLENFYNIKIMQYLLTKLLPTDDFDVFREWEEDDIPMTIGNVWKVLENNIKKDKPPNWVGTIYLALREREEIFIANMKP